MKPYKYNGKMNERLMAIRDALGMTQEAIGRGIGITGARFGHLERRNGMVITERVVQMLCLVYSVNYDYLVNGEGPMFVEEDARLKKVQHLFLQLIDSYQQCAIDSLSALLSLQEREHPQNTEDEKQTNLE